MRTVRRLGQALTALTLPMIVASCNDPEARPPTRLSPLRALASTFPEAGTAPLDASATGARPRGALTVGIVVDQLAAWVVEERLSELPSDGGFARLAREGARVRQMEYAHAVTDTAPGHASLYTGRTPRESGIFGNEVFDEADKRVSILRDPKAMVVTSKGETTRPGSSPHVLLVPTVSEAFLAKTPDARLLSISWKDRGAILPAGHVKDRATVLWLSLIHISEPTRPY